MNPSLNWYIKKDRIAVLNRNDAIAIVKQSYDYPNHAWETRYAADIGKRKLLNVLRYLANPDRYERPKNRVYRSNRPEVENAWDICIPPHNR